MVDGGYSMQCYGGSTGIQSAHISTWLNIARLPPPSLGSNVHTGDYVFANRLIGCFFLSHQQIFQGINFIIKIVIEFYLMHQSQL